MDKLLFANAASGQMSLLMLVGMLALMYFLLVRPQKKQLKIRNDMLNNLAAGDRVITNGGLTGYIRALTEEYIYVEIAEGLTVEMIRAAVTQVVNEDEENDSVYEELPVEDEDEDEDDK